MALMIEARFSGANADLMAWLKTDRMVAVIAPTSTNTVPKASGAWRESSLSGSIVGVTLRTSSGRSHPALLFGQILGMAGAGISFAVRLLGGMMK